ncbi:hypothetical protein E4T80_11625 [Muribacter muris]|uniref:Uncharacterized protein n=1 Tax=Muribacter muris TaxID=67855 RepID=A0A4Y9JSR2_9PAST|nr:hypothetical protein [Muribacter muris]MBF0786112.1 hypothetical protein [Muribacter muris]MBF0826467.1 hypothetical protein [Muribacter muris]TFV07949.1 hypothetical protein E4T80_11625 [Muribacter muris]
MAKQKNYILDEQGQDYLRNALNTLWQAQSLIELIAKVAEAENDYTLISALNGVLVLMNNGLNDLGEV